ncbi:MAG: hypothetical protein ABEH58_06145 [Haloplanus sp.]
MSAADRTDAAGRTLNCPPGDVTVTEDGERIRATWHPRKGERRVALFRVITDDGVAVLQHVRRVLVYQRGDETGCYTDTDVRLSDVPDARLAVVRDLGYVPVEEVER